jgi:hypothetical protein
VAQHAGSTTQIYIDVDHNGSFNTSNDIVTVENGNNPAHTTDFIF